MSDGVTVAMEAFNVSVVAMDTSRSGERTKVQQPSLCNSGRALRQARLTSSGLVEARRLALR
jgi:hypothetical protein